MTGITSLTVTVPLPDAKQRGNGRGYWRAKAALVAAARHTANILTRQALNVQQIAGDVSQARLTYTVMLADDQRFVDDDNIISGMKSYRDGIADGIGLVNDRHWRIDGPVEYQRHADKTAPSEVIVRVDWTHTV